MHHAMRHDMRHGLLHDSLDEGKTRTLPLTPTSTRTRYDEGKIAPTQLFETIIEMDGAGAARATRRRRLSSHCAPLPCSARLKNPQASS